jgi:hypothetical protein
MHIEHHHDDMVTIERTYLQMPEATPQSRRQSNFFTAGPVATSPLPV